MACLSDKIIKSPKEKYSLKISSIETKPGCWNYTVGIVFDSAGFLIKTITRNYSSFPYLFIEDHPNGHDYLVCGEDYQGQTVVELDTGKVRSFLPEEAKKGVGFCWSSYVWSHEQQLLIVDGCYWACPYEFRFYDFSDPMSGWPQLEIQDDVYLHSSDKNPEVLSDGKIIAYGTRITNADSDDEEDELEVVVKHTLERDGLNLKLIDTWMDPAEEKRRREQKERQKKWEEEWKIYTQTDPLYLMVNNLDGGYFSTGTVYDDWCPDFKGKDGRVCRRMVERRKFDNHEWTADLEWGRTIAPIKLITYMDGKTFEIKFYEHSVAGMIQAISRYRELVGLDE